MAVSAVVALASTGAAVSASAIIAGTMTLSAFATTFAVNFALGAALRALTPKPSIGGIGEVLTVAIKLQLLAQH